MNAIQQAAIQPIRLHVSYVMVALRPIAGHGAEGARRVPRPGRSRTPGVIRRPWQPLPQRGARHMTGSMAWLEMRSGQGRPPTLPLVTSLTGWAFAGRLGDQRPALALMSAGHGTPMG
jgi:hypothetical protein